MLIDNHRFRRKLEAIIRDLTPDVQWREDLLQAVLLHVCRMELERESAATPARTE